MIDSSHGVSMARLQPTVPGVESTHDDELTRDDQFEQSIVTPTNKQHTISTHSTTQQLHIHVIRSAHNRQSTTATTKHSQRIQHATATVHLRTNQTISTSSQGSTLHSTDTSDSTTASSYKNTATSSNKQTHTHTQQQQHLRYNRQLNNSHLHQLPHKQHQHTHPHHYMWYQPRQPFQTNGQLQKTAMIPTQT